MSKWLLNQTGYGSRDCTCHVINIATVPKQEFEVWGKAHNQRLSYVVGCQVLKISQEMHYPFLI